MLLSVAKSPSISLFLSEPHFGMKNQSVGHVSSAESLDFNETESVIWRKHHLRRFFQDRGNWWNSSRRTTAWKWILVIFTGVLVACIATSVQLAIEHLTEAKFKIVLNLVDSRQWAQAFFIFLGFCLFYSSIAGILCIFEPFAGGSGIPEIKAYLNGVNLDKIIHLRVLITKVIGMMFSVSSGLPLGKEGPMIHTGSIVGAAVSQGKTDTFGFDTSWTKFQDLRNDRIKRDFVTFGAAAGVAAAFNAPVGGILFTLEEGASFWSTSHTFRSFFCAMMSILTISLIFAGTQIGEPVTIGVQFGIFDTASYRFYELFIFALMGVGGGVLGSIFNYINRRVNEYRMDKLKHPLKKLLELSIITLGFAFICFVLPLCWQICTPMPTATATYTLQEYELLNHLIQFQCGENEYNQVASLFMNNADSAMQLLFHYNSPNSNDYITFSTGSLLLFFIPYFLVAAITSGAVVPAGLFVPTLMAGAAYGRIIGYILNLAFPGTVASPGVYSLVGASAILGGVARMTIAGAVIVIEACGSTSYLLPIMITFAASRYSGNAINDPIYEMLIRLKELPFLEGSLKTLGLLNFHPISELMAKPVNCINEISRVKDVYEVLQETSHNAYPVLDKNGHLRGLIMRKALCSLLKFKTFSFPVKKNENDSFRDHTLYSADGDIKDRETLGSLPTSPALLRSLSLGHQSTITSASTMFYDTMERAYPDYPSVADILLLPSEMEAWLDVRPYMDTAPYTTHESSSVQRCYRFFRTMGLRHLIILDADHCVTGIVTRKDLTEHRLERFWVQEGENMQKFVNVDPQDSMQRMKNNDIVRPEDYPPIRLYRTDPTGHRSKQALDGQDAISPKVGEHPPTNGAKGTLVVGGSVSGAGLYRHAASSGVQYTSAGSGSNSTSSSSRQVNDTEHVSAPGYTSLSAPHGPIPVEPSVYTPLPQPAGPSASTGQSTIVGIDSLQGTSDVTSTVTVNPVLTQMSPSPVVREPPVRSNRTRDSARVDKEPKTMKRTNV